MSAVPATDRDDIEPVADAEVRTIVGRAIERYIAARHERVAEFVDKGFRFVSVGNDLHHILTQAAAYVKDVEGLGKAGAEWARRPSALIG